VKNPNGKAPIPNDMWKPPSPNPKPGKPYKNEKSDSKTVTSIKRGISTCLWVNFIVDPASMAGI
jgi:hypothetical protein